MDKKTEFIIFIIMLLFAGFFINKEESLSCNSKYSYCKTLRTNFYNFSSTKNLLLPKDIEGTKVLSYRTRTGGRHSRTVTRYELRFVSKSGPEYKIFDGYASAKYAESTGQEIIECLKHEKYPCKFGKY